MGARRITSEGRRLRISRTRHFGPLLTELRKSSNSSTEFTVLTPPNAGRAVKPSSRSLFHRRDLSVDRGHCKACGQGGCGAAEPRNRSSIPDLLIGATALSLGYSVLTVNARHFGPIPSLSFSSEMQQNSTDASWQDKRGSLDSEGRP
jgi:predicted nucleic acid-binding protein